ncbi:MAG: hypothetical protein HQ528_11895 [Candidatus Marinimicrobia bacterium]|nr:hypothetical protein [Candidatus Neomarinimicrobiota bacterium]
MKDNEIARYKIAIELYKLDAQAQHHNFNIFFIVHAIILGFIFRILTTDEISSTLLITVGIAGIFLCILMGMGYYRISRLCHFRVDQAIEYEPKGWELVGGKSKSYHDNKVVKLSEGAEKMKLLGRLKNNNIRYIVIFLITIVYVIFVINGCQKLDSSFTSINWELTIELILVIAAAGAAIFAGLTWKQAQKFREDERRIKHAYLTPINDPGHFKKITSETDQSVLLVGMINSGYYACNNIKADLFLFGTDQSPIRMPIGEPEYSMTFNCVNPVPHEAIWTIDISRDGLLRLGFTNNYDPMDHYLIVKVRYYDIVLKIIRDDIFSWYIGSNHLLGEYDIEIKNILESLVSNYDPII